MKKKILLIPIMCFLLTSCNAGVENLDISYLNYKYVLNCSANLHGLDPRTNEVLERNISKENRDRDIYTKYFDKEKSFINFQCVGSTFEDFKCETSFYLTKKNGDIVVSLDLFYTKYSGGESGVIIFKDAELGNQIGTIYVYTPYWCRCQFNIDANDDGNKELLTFEFWKNTYNPLPDIKEK